MYSKKRGSKFLKGLRSYRVGSGLQAQAIETYLESLDCPRALSVAILFRSGEHLQLARLECDPSQYSDAESARDAYAATLFLSKFSGLSTGLDLEGEAFRKFEKFELLCKRTNARFRYLESDPLFRGPVVHLHNAVVRKISRLLGEFSFEEFVSLPDWGPGASTLIKRRDASSPIKFQYETGITRDLHDLVPSTLLCEVYPHWGKHLGETDFPSYQVGNRITSVAKDAKANRIIAIEPGINLWFQKSIGDMIAHRLRRVGVDLRYQNKNQQFALSGSLSNQVATIDLSSASDSISRAVVEALLPPRWHSVMDAVRSHYGVLEGSTKMWEKFSSMGNGFTFPLESLIFYAVSYCCTEYVGADLDSVSVYGDDIVLPVSAFPLFSDMMSFYGFQINETKSFVNSPFRESCGAHFYSGIDIKPIYLKDKLSDVLTVYRLANAVRRQAHRRGFSHFCDSRLRKPFELLVQSVPSALRLRIPETLGDGGFISNLDEATPSYARRGFEGFRVQNVIVVSQTRQFDETGYLLSSLWEMSMRVREEIHVVLKHNPALPSILEARRKEGFKALTATDNGVRSRFDGESPRKLEDSRRNTIPTSRMQLQLTSSIVRQWYDLGPWL